MLTNYLRVTTRSLSRRRLYTSISVAVLAVGLAICLLVIGLVSYELSFEDFHVNGHRIFRVEATVTEAGSDSYVSATVPPLLGKALGEELPEVDRIAVFRPELLDIIKVGGLKHKVIDDHANDGYVHHPTAMFANADYLHVFSFPVKEGNADSILNTPASLLITESAARRYFPNQDPIGQVIEINETYLCTVAGVLSDMPQNTQLYCDMIVSYRTLESVMRPVDPNEPPQQDYAFVLLRDGRSANGVADKVNAIAARFIDTGSERTYRFGLRSLKDIYFIGYNVSVGEFSPQGELSMIIELSMTALFILLLAIANYVNLATAMGAERTKEIGVRKVLGANRMHILFQSLGESLVLTAVSAAIGLIIYEVLKAGLRGVLPRPMLVDPLASQPMMIGVVVLVAAVGFLSGLYPGLFLSRYRPIAVLAANRGRRSQRLLMRKGLIVFQFAIATAFVFVVVVMYQQAAYRGALMTGFDPRDIMAFDFYGKHAVSECQRLRNELDGKPFVVHSTICSVPPGRNVPVWYRFFLTEQRDDREATVTQSNAVDYDFQRTFSIVMTKGRWFSRDVDSDRSTAIVVNSAMANRLWNGDAIGRRLYRKDGYVEVIGVADYAGAGALEGGNNFSILKIDPDKSACLAVKIAPGQSAAALGAIGQIWKRILPETEFKYEFLENELESGRREDAGDRQMFLALAFMAIGIACLGIFGLVSFSAGQRAKEIGIRKVLGASIPNVVSDLSREFLWLILMGGVLGCSLGYLLAQDVLRGLAVRAPIRLETAVLTIAISLVTGLGIGGLRAWRAAAANPVESLKYE